MHDRSISCLPISTIAPRGDETDEAGGIKGAADSDSPKVRERPKSLPSLLHFATQPFSRPPLPPMSSDIPQDVQYTVLSDADEVTSTRASDDEPEGEGAHLMDSTRTSEDTQSADIEDLNGDDYQAETPGNALITGSSPSSDLSGSTIARIARKASKSAAGQATRVAGMISDVTTWQSLADTLYDTAHYTWVAMRVSPSSEIRASWIDSCLPADLTLFDETERPDPAALANQALRAMVTIPRSVAYATCCLCLDCSKCNCCYGPCKDAKDEGRARFLPGRYNARATFQQDEHYTSRHELRGMELVRAILSASPTAETAVVHGYLGLSSGTSLTPEPSPEQDAGPDAPDPGETA